MCFYVIRLQIIEMIGHKSLISIIFTPIPGRFKVLKIFLLIIMHNNIISTIDFFTQSKIKSMDKMNNQ